MKALFATSSLVLVLGLCSCGSNPESDFRQALPLEEAVGERLGAWIVARGHAAGPVLVLTHPAAGPWQQEADRRRIAGLQRGLATVRVVVKTALPEHDERVAFLQHDYLPAEVVRENVAAMEMPSAVISLAGFPYHEPPSGALPPLYVFGMNRQDLARSGVKDGWAEAIVYSKGSDDVPAEMPAHFPPDVLQSYAVEVR